MEEIYKWLLTIVSASIAAYFGSLFALSRAKREKLWHQKQEAYLSIIESLHNIIIWADEEYASSFPYPVLTVSKEKLDELRKKQQKSLDILKKNIHLGELVVSKNASAKLEEFISDYVGEESAFFHDPYYEEPGPEHKEAERIAEHYLKLREIVEKRIEEVKKIAKNDLGL